MKHYTQADLAKYPFFDDFDFESGIDYLTGVLDRRSITGLIQHQIENKIPFAIAICDFDNFKKVNDIYGHFYGDIALKEVSKAIYEVSREWGLVGRFGGDEFLIYIHGTNDYDDIWKKVKSINDIVKQIVFEDVLKNLVVTETVGVARFPFDSNSYEDLFKKADKALYRGKQKGRNCFIIYKDEMHKNIDTTNSSSIISLKEMIKRACKVLDMEVSIDEKIRHIFSAMSKEYGIDHICINIDGRIENDFTRKTNPRKYSYIDQGELKSVMDDDCFYTNDYSTIKCINPTLHRLVYDQQVKALFLYELRYDGETFGIVRIEDSSVKRIWQDYEMIAYVALLNIVAMLKYNQKYGEKKAE